MDSHWPCLYILCSMFSVWYMCGVHLLLICMYAICTHMYAICVCMYAIYVYVCYMCMYAIYVCMLYICICENEGCVCMHVCMKYIYVYVFMFMYTYLYATFICASCMHVYDINYYYQSNHPTAIRKISH